jgi:hypothetical protein
MQQKSGHRCLYHCLPSWSRSFNTFLHLIMSVGSNGGWSLPSIMKILVWYFVSDNAQGYWWHSFFVVSSLVWLGTNGNSVPFICVGVKLSLPSCQCHIRSWSHIGGGYDVLMTKFDLYNSACTVVRWSTLKMYKWSLGAQVYWKGSHKPVKGGYIQPWLLSIYVIYLTPNGSTSYHSSLRSGT